MASDGRRKRSRKVRPGDGHELQRYRWWQLFSRALFHADLLDSDNTSHRWSVDVRLGGDSDGNVVAKLYRDGRHHSSSGLPAAFDVPGGTIEVVASGFGLKRCHYVSDGSHERQLAPDPASAEGRRARLDRTHPAVSRLIGALSIVILLIALVLGVPQIIEQITSIPPVADAVGTYTSPIRLPVWANTSLLVASLIASTERALRLRYNWLLDGGLFDGDLDG